MDAIKKAFKYTLGFGLGLCAVMVISTAVMSIFVIALKQGSNTELPLDVKTEHAVGVVDLNGEIFSSDKFQRSLEQFLEDDRIKAVVVRVDSPGGAVGPSEEMYRAIQKGKRQKPIVCSLGTVAASGGLFAASACQKIVSNESTITGSIGVIMMSPNVKGLLERLGVSMTVIKAGKLKDTGSPFRETTQEDRDYLQALIGETHEQFIRTVAEGRGLNIEDVRKVADGRIILGGKAKELGLVDEIGSVEDAAKLALSIAGDQSKPELVRAPKPVGLMSIFTDMPDSESVSRWFHTRLLYHSLL